MVVVMCVLVNKFIHGIKCHFGEAFGIKSVTEGVPIN